MRKGTSVTNFDEIKKHLRDELGILSKKLDGSLKNMQAQGLTGLDMMRMSGVKDMLEQMLEIYEHVQKNIELSPTINVAQPEINIPEIKIPDIHIPEIKVPECIVNVPAPIVNVKASDVTLDIQRIVDALEPLNLLSNDPESPIAVRMSNGTEFMDTLKQIAESGQKLVAYSSNSGYSTIDNTPSNPAKVAIYDASGNQITSFGGGTQYADGAVRGTATGTLSMADDGTNIQSISCDSTGKLNLNNISGTISIPTGASTSAKQDTGNTSVASIDTKTPALGQALAASSVPVVLTAAQITTLTPPAAITGFSTSAKQDTLLTELQLKADLTETQPVSLASVPSHAVTNVGTFAVQAAGDVAHDGVDSGNPVKVGAKAVSSEPTAVANADRANLITDLVGKLIVLPYANPENFVSGCISSAMTGTTTTSLLAAPASGLRNYITQITVSNSHATVGTDILIQDGSGGTTLYVIPAASVYGGATLTFPTPLRQPTTATAIYCQNVTTGANVKVSASGYKGA